MKVPFLLGFVLPSLKKEQVMKFPFSAGLMVLEAYRFQNQTLITKQVKYNSIHPNSTSDKCMHSFQRRIADSQYAK